MFVRRLLAVASLCAASIAAPATAATFAPDMWVYKIERQLVSVYAPIHARALAPEGTEVPKGCTSSPSGTPGTVEVFCNNPPGIDFHAYYTQRPGVTDPLTTLVAFNSGGVVCIGELVPNCGAPAPAARSAAARSAAPASMSGALFDVALGTLDLWPGSFEYSWAASLRPTGVSGLIVYEASGSGTWDFGLGGSWWTGSAVETGVEYRITGSLVSKPTPVPLPAGLPLLAAGLGALALVRRARTAAPT